MAAMISELSPLPVGNAVQISLDGLPATTVHWRVLRNVTGVFPAFNDPASVLVMDCNEGDPQTFVDFGAGLINGTLTYYQAFYFNGTTWSTDAAPSSCTPATTYVDESVDAQSIVIDRLTAGINAEIARGALNPIAGSIEVLSAPPVFSEELRWPVISVHMNSEAPVDRALGEQIADDNLNTLTDLWEDHEGWHGKTQLAIIGWSLNADERIILRKAIRRILIANLKVFDAALLLQVEVSQQDIEDFSSYSAAVYETVCTFTCVTPLAVNAPAPPITDVEVTVIPLN
jgi:hypothetical protein